MTVLDLRFKADLSKNHSKIFSKLARAKIKDFNKIIGKSYSHINKKNFSARLIKKDLSKDLALLKVNKRGKAVRFFNGQLEQGSEVEALGHPRGLKFSLSKGTVSAIRKYASTYDVLGTPNVLFIQTDAAINPGNSGGPLFYKNKVVGVNTQGLSKNENEGLNFAVHFDEVKSFLK